VFHLSSTNSYHIHIQLPLHSLPRPHHIIQPSHHQTPQDPPSNLPKPHHKYMYPHFTSNHPRHIFPGIIKTATIRYSRLSSTVDDYNFIHKLFTLRLTALQHPNQLITANSFPWLTHAAHQWRINYKKLT